MCVDNACWQTIIIKLFFCSIVNINSVLNSRLCPKTEPCTCGKETKRLAIPIWKPKNTKKIWFFTVAQQKPVQYPVLWVFLRLDQFFVWVRGCTPFPCPLLLSYHSSDSQTCSDGEISWRSSWENRGSAQECVEWHSLVLWTTSISEAGIVSYGPVSSHSVWSRGLMTWLASKAKVDTHIVNNNNPNFTRLFTFNMRTIPVKWDRKIWNLWLNYDIGKLSVQNKNNF